MRLTMLACDRADCGARWPPQPTEHLDRRDARLAGWETTYGQDLCPDHSSRAKLVEHVRRLAAEGLNDATIGAAIGHGRGFVWSVRKRHGIAGQATGRPRGRTREEVTDASPQPA